MSDTAAASPTIEHEHFLEMIRFWTSNRRIYCPKLNSSIHGLVLERPWLDRKGKVLLRRWRVDDEKEKLQKAVHPETVLLSLANWQAKHVVAATHNSHWLWALLTGVREPRGCFSFCSGSDQMQSFSPTFY